MPFTLVGWKETTTAAVTLAAIDALPDPHVRVSGDDVWVPEELAMLAAYFASGATLTAARIESPTLRTLVPIDVVPLNLATEPATPPAAVFQPANPKPVGGGEALNVKASDTAIDTIVALAWLASGPLTPAAGEIFTVKATNLSTLTAYAWTNGPLTFAQSLPKGRYQVVGMAAKSAGMVAARLVFSGYAWRPGCLGCDAYSDILQPDLRNGKMGVWGEFDHDLPPTVDFLSISADTSQEVWLDLIKIA